MISCVKRPLRSLLFCGVIEPPVLAFTGLRGRLQCRRRSRRLRVREAVADDGSIACIEEIFFLVFAFPAVAVSVSYHVSYDVPFDYTRAR